MFPLSFSAGLLGIGPRSHLHASPPVNVTLLAAPYLTGWNCSVARKAGAAPRDGAGESSSVGSGMAPPGV